MIVIAYRTYVGNDISYYLCCCFLLSYIGCELLSSGIMGEYEPKIEVQFPEIVHVAKGLTVKLECFALGK